MLKASAPNCALKEDHRASELGHSEEVGWVVFPANDNATVVLRPSKQALDLLRVQRKKKELMSLRLSFQLPNPNLNSGRILESLCELLGF
jgi:hypothetical protein